MNSFWEEMRNSKPPKFKTMVLSYAAHANHFVLEEKKKINDPKPENVFEGFSKTKKSRKRGQ
jgi:hypothetical protein|tara:strand:- start:414 stop:599 length:186 start_codon:yes stop_codon:yes gene_type:complete